MNPDGKYIFSNDISLIFILTYTYLFIPLHFVKFIRLSVVSLDFWVYLLQSIWSNRNSEWSVWWGSADVNITARWVSMSTWSIKASYYIYRISLFKVFNCLLLKKFTIDIEWYHKYLFICIQKKISLNHQIPLKKYIKLTSQTL